MPNKETKEMNVLSLFDGLSGGRIALDRMGIVPTAYFSSEIDKDAIKCSQANWSDITRIGDVTKVSYKDGILYTESGEYETKIDLLIGGSPCQSYSSALALGGREITGLEGKSSLFYHYLRIKTEIEEYNNNLIWLLENVKMKNESKLQLDTYLKTEGVYINSKDFSFQKRARYYWTNLKIKPWQDKGISFQDYKCTGDMTKNKVNRTPSRERMWEDGNGGNSNKSCANVTDSDKVYCLTTKQDRCPNSGLVEYEDFCRYLTQREMELAQTVPVGYTSSLSYNKACAVLGNGWTIDVICHVLQGIKDV